MPQPSQAEIAARAYHIWEKEGRPHGRDFEHWLEAEREMRGTFAPPPRKSEPASARQAVQRRLSAAATAKPRRTRKATPPAN